LRRTIKYDATGHRVSDTITNLINNTDLEAEVLRDVKRLSSSS